MITTTVVYAVASIVLFSVVLALAVGRGIRLADEREPVNRADIPGRTADEVIAAYLAAADAAEADRV